jgi:hypothetical protein
VGSWWLPNPFAATLRVMRGPWRVRFYGVRLPFTHGWAIGVLRDISDQEQIDG